MLGQAELEQRGQNCNIKSAMEWPAVSVGFCVHSGLINLLSMSSHKNPTPTECEMDDVLCTSAVCVYGSITGE